LGIAKLSSSKRGSKIYIPRRVLKRCLAIFLTIGVFGSTAPTGLAAPPHTRQQALDLLKPLDGPVRPQVGVKLVNRSTLTGKVMAGYQGWFNAPGDGSGRSWVHYSKRGKFEPGRNSIDLWPDVSELDDDEKFATPFRHADGSTAHVFSSHKRKTVLRHFKWMEEYGIDGVFLQRFATQARSSNSLYHLNTVLNHCREGANQ
jgi:hypothetical protein